ARPHGRRGGRRSSALRGTHAPRLANGPATRRAAEAGATGRRLLHPDAGGQAPRPAGPPGGRTPARVIVCCQGTEVPPGPPVNRVELPMTITIPSKALWFASGVAAALLAVAMWSADRSGAANQPANPPAGQAVSPEKFWRPVPAEVPKDGKVR